MGGPGDTEKVKRKILKTGRRVGSGNRSTKASQPTAENFRGQQTYENLTNVNKLRKRKRKTGEL